MSLYATPETFGFDAEHCSCCQRAIRVCNIVVWRHLIGSRLAHRHAEIKHDDDPFNPGDCACCQVAAERIADLHRLERMFSGMWLTEQRHHLRAQQLLNAAIRVLPAGTALPDSLERAAADQANLDAAYRRDLEHMTAQRDVLLDGLTAILWALEGGPTDPVYAKHIAPISEDHPLEDIARALNKILEGSGQALRGQRRPVRANVKPKQISMLETIS